MYLKLLHTFYLCFQSFFFFSILKGLHHKKVCFYKTLALLSSVIIFNPMTFCTPQDDSALSSSKLREVTIKHN